MNIYITTIIIFIIAIAMASVGKGGGNFYVLTLILSGITIHSAATGSQLIMFGTALFATLIFYKNKKIDWQLNIIVGPPLYVFSYIGGFFSKGIPGTTLKVFFAIILAIISLFMLIKFKEKEIKPVYKFGYINRTRNNQSYTINLYQAIPLSALIGFFSGAIGISGGSFIIPMIVILFGVPMGIAIGTSSVMVMFTALAGFLGHISNAPFDYTNILYFLLAAIIGGMIGGIVSVKNKPKHLKLIFAVTNIIASILMILNIIFN